VCVCTRKEAPVLDALESPGVKGRGCVWCLWWLKAVASTLCARWESVRSLITAPASALGTLPPHLHLLLVLVTGFQGCLNHPCTMPCCAGPLMTTPAPVSPPGTSPLKHAGAARRRRWVRAKGLGSIKEEGGSSS